MIPESVLEIPGNVVARDVGGETVILDIEKGSYFSLDAVGARVWELIGQGLTLAAICDRIHAEFDVARDVAEQDLIELTTELAKEQLVRVRG